MRKRIWKSLLFLGLMIIAIAFSTTDIKADTCASHAVGHSMAASHWVNCPYCLGKNRID